MKRRHMRTSRRFDLALVFSIFLPMAAAAGEKHLGDPPLSAALRALVRQKMAQHSKQMNELVWAVVFLDHRETARLATAVATESRLGRAASSDATELNSALPPRFFALQEQLKERAENLAAAARTWDAHAVARGYGQLAETCVSCHEVYLQH
jgi:cytochrome c556